MHYQPSLSLNQTPWAEKTLYPTSNPLGHLSTGFKYFSAVFQPGCGKSCFGMEVASVNIWEKQHFWADCLHPHEVMFLVWGLDLSNQAGRACTPGDDWEISALMTKWSFPWSPCSLAIGTVCWRHTSRRGEWSTSFSYFPRTYRSINISKKRN